ncbi:MAG: hypothetical protein AB7S71_00890 [Dongiaceae bacterium]
MDALSAVRHDHQPAPPILDLLRSFGIADANALYALAARLPAAADVDDPTRAARTIIGRWFARLLDRADLEAEEAFRLGRAAFVALDGGSLWPKALLSDDVPGELAEQIRRSLPAPCPAAAQAVMVVQSLGPPAPFAAGAAWLRGRLMPVRTA